MVIIADDEPPQVEIIAPLDGSAFTAGLPFRIAAQATDNVSIGSVEFYAEFLPEGESTVQSELIQVVVAPPYEVSYTFDADRVGVPVTFFARAKDTAFPSNEATASITVTVDADNPPLITAITPEDGAEITENTLVTLTASVEDDVDVARVEFLVDGQTVGSDLVAPYTAQYNVGENPGEVASLTVHAFDSAGQQAAQTLTYSIIPDQPPYVEMRRPIEGSLVFSGQSLRFQANAIDDLAINRVEFFVNETRAATVRLPLNASENSFYDEDIFEAFFTTPADAERNVFEIYAVAYDFKGQSARSETVTVGQLEDTTSPVVDLLSPVTGDILSENEASAFSGRALDLAGVQTVSFFRDLGSAAEPDLLYTDASPAVDNAWAPFGFDYLVPSGSAGEIFEFFAVAEDFSGNTAESETVAIEVGMGTTQILTPELELSPNTIIPGNVLHAEAEGGFLYHLSDFGDGWRLDVYDATSGMHNLRRLGEGYLLHDRLSDRETLPEDILFEGAHAFTIHRNYAYIIGYDEEAALGHLTVLDLSLPFALEFVGQISFPSAGVHSITTEGDMAIVGNGEFGLIFYDVSRPENPVLSDQILTTETVLDDSGFSVSGGGDFRDVVVDDQFLFAASGAAGLLIYDISQPDNPQVNQDGLINLEGQPFTAPGAIVSIEVQDDYAFLGLDVLDDRVAFQNTLLVVDVSNPAQPVVVRELNYELARPDFRNGGVRSVFVKGSLVVISLDVLRDLDVETPEFEGAFAKDLLQLIDLGDLSDPSDEPAVLLNANLRGPGYGITHTAGSFAIPVGLGGVQIIPQQVLSVDAVQPGGYASGVGTGSDITIEFSEAVDSLSISGLNASNISLLKNDTGGGSLVPVNVFADGNRLIVDPIDLLEPNAVYTLEISSSVLALSQRALGRVYRSVFLTGQAELQSDPFVAEIENAEAPGADRYLDLAGGDTVTITGSGFSDDPTVYIGGVLAEIVSASDTEIVVLTPRNGAGTAALEIISDGGAYRIIHGAFVYLNELSIALVTPAVGSLDGGDVVEIIGEGFMPGATCFFGPTPALEVTVLSPTRIRCVVPPRALFGFVDISVYSADGARSAFLQDGFLYSQFVERFFLANHSDFDSLINPTPPLSFDPTRELAPGFPSALAADGDVLFVAIDSSDLSSDPEGIATDAQNLGELESGSVSSSVALVRLPREVTTLLEDPEDPTSVREDTDLILDQINLPLPLIPRDIAYTEFAAGRFAIVAFDTERLPLLAPDQLYDDPGFVLIEVFDLFETEVNLSGDTVPSLDGEGNLIYVLD
ncbi:MAG: IPT/TIG domain-containing protein, partial [Opitutales bacterium]|nr:IPT/TIG domain-containing protein [Opitutales bacterium]